MTTAMKRLHFFCAIIAVAAVCASCERESGLGYESKNKISFTFGSSDTKAVGMMPVQTAVYDLGHNGLQLVEELSSLDGLYSGPDTKGTPAYTSNIADLYGSFTADVYNATGANKINSLSNAEFSYDKVTDSWVHLYPTDPWNGNEKLWFFIHMGSMSSVSGMTSSVTASPACGQIEFSYTSPANATEQEDIVFASRSLTKAQEKAGAKILLYHALSGVKFKIGDLGEDIAGIKEISFNGLKDKGTCTISAQYGEWAKDNSNAGATDGTKSADCSVWTSLSATEGYVAKAVFESGEMAGQDLSSGSDYDFPDSFYGANTAKANLNDKNFSKTFFLIPQVLTDDVTITIKVVNTDRQDITFTIPFGKMAKESNNNNSVEIKAGELRTYTFSIKDSSDITVEETLEDAIKKDVFVKNVSGLPVYLRAVIVANWYKDIKRDGETKSAIVAPYNNEGTFTGLAAEGSGWVKDGDYYYYTEKVNANSPTTTNLFDSFTYSKENVPVEGAYLVMSIVTQARVALDEYADYQAAWELN